jgi:LysM repeat protein
MSIVRAERAGTPASHLPSPAVAVPVPRRPEPAAAPSGDASSAARTASAVAPRHATRPAAPSRQHVRAVLTGSPRSARSAPRLRIVRPGDQPAAYRSPAAARPGTVLPSGQPGQPARVPARTDAARPSGAAPRPPRPGAQLTAARSRPAPPSGVRLTRRGRVVLSAFGLALILGLITILWATLANGAQAASGRTHTGSVYQGLHRVTVLPGQTLWTIAQQAEPSADPRTVIPQIMQINAISSTSLQPGQQLWVPRS